MQGRVTQRNDGKPTQVQTAVNVSGVMGPTSWTKTFSYDAVNRLSGTTRPDSSVVNRTYTAQGSTSRR